jgi:hypothetical protein
VSYVLRCFPRDDDTFAAEVARGMERFDGVIPHDWDGVPETLADFLRASYPLIAVHRSHQLAIVSPHERTLYIYRDGRISPSRLPAIPPGSARRFGPRDVGQHGPPTETPRP